LAVEHLRHLWRPDHVRVVLLAESHVWTSREEAKSRVIQPDGVETGFARFIYCLGGGEPQLVFPSVSPNVGASQYWTLLHDSVYGPDQSHQALLKSGEPKSSRRVANKLKLLHEMRGSGPALSHRRCADNPFTPQVCQAKQRRQRYREKKPSRHVPTSCARTGAYNAAPMGHERQSTTRPSLTNLCKPPTDPR
jgi:hypothetical protein